MLAFRPAYFAAAAKPHGGLRLAYRSTRRLAFKRTCLAVRLLAAPGADATVSPLRTEVRGALPSGQYGAPAG